MSLNDSGTLQIVQCPRCASVILAGWAEGLFWRVDPYALSISDAIVLKQYGVSVLLADWVANNWLAQIWHPCQHDMAGPNRHLLAPHVCGSAHALQEPR